MTALDPNLQSGDTRGKDVYGSEAVSLYVDLDGSLVRSDILVEAAFALLRQNPFIVFLLPIWLCRGKAYLKQRIADRVELDVASLPYHERFLQFLIEEKAKGRAVWLATASNAKYAKAIADHLGLFSGVLASDEETNLSGWRKLERIVENEGRGNFDYAGNSRVDLQVWRNARRAILVSPEPGLVAAAARCAQLGEVFPCEPGKFRRFLLAIRIHQWAKNVLVFLPLLAAHEYRDPALVMQAAIAFVAFGLCASSAYLLNDLVDLPSDRRHPRKRLRPFASGDMSVTLGIALVPLLLISAIAVAWLLPIEFLVVLMGYYVATIAYSFWLKRIVLVDVLVLAGLYTVRVIGGAAAVSIAPSFWLLAFSMFLFLSLAMVKRYSELLELKARGADGVRGRGYQVVDLDSLLGMGTAAGYMAVMVLALYINSESVVGLYSRPEAIWLLCPLLLYWISRIWVAVRRGKMHDDPVVFAIRDRVSQLVALVAGAVLILAV